MTRWTSEQLRQYLLPPLAAGACPQEWETLARNRIIWSLGHLELSDKFIEELDAELDLLDKIAICRLWALRLVTERSRKEQAEAEVWRLNQQVLDDYQTAPWWLHWSQWRLDKAVRRAESLGLTVVRSRMAQNVKEVY